MPEWKQEIRRRLAPSQFEPAREAEIVEELSQRLDDCYEESLANGARSRDVLRIVILDGMKLMLLGLIIGLPASYGLTKLMKSCLYGVSLTDPLTFSVISVTLLAVTLLACYAPARRATKVDPMAPLRCE